MRRIVNLVIGLAVVTGIAIVLFGSIGSRGSRDDAAMRPRDTGERGIGQLGAAATIVGPAAPPPPIPDRPLLPPLPPPDDPWVAALVAAPTDPPQELLDARWAIVEARLRSRLGGALDDKVRDALYAALYHWARAQGEALAAFYGGYIDRARLGQHLGWSRNEYVLAVEAALGHERFQRFAAGADFAEVSPLD